MESDGNSTVFATVENFRAERGFEILLLNPMAEEKNIRKFIRG